MKKNTLHIPNTPIRFSIFLTKPFWLWAALAIVIVICAQVLETSTYYIFKNLIDTASGFMSGSAAAAAVLPWVMLYPVAAIGHSLLYRMSGLTAMQWITKAQKYGRDVLFEHLSFHSHTYFADRFAGSLGSKIWNATDGVGSLIETTLWSYINMGVAFLGSLLLIYLASPLLTLVYAFWIVVLLGLSYFLSKKNAALSEANYKERTKLTGVIIDIVTNMAAVQQYARRGLENIRVRQGTDDLRKTAVRRWLGGEVMLIVSNIVMGFFVVSMLAGAFMVWRADNMTTGSFIMILTLMSSLTGWFSHIGNTMNAFAREYGSIQEGLGELLKPHGIRDVPGAHTLERVDGHIAFRQVSFTYPGKKEPVYDGLTLTIPAGQRVGIVGSSGSGKTTLMKLLLREYDIAEGVISVSDYNIAHVSQDSLRRSIAVVPQESVLFHRTLRENIAYGKPDATDEEIYDAARKAQIHEFITELPEGYNTLVGERGVKLSGGQRQRVAIARAILKAAPILVLDEATSSLDSESESLVQAALHELMRGKTVIAIAHRLSTIREMDRIIVLERGRIVEDGAHGELLLNPEGIYARLWNHQAGGFLQGEEEGGF